MKPYKPRSRNKRILDVAWNHVQSVPYRVSLRWVFYRLHQDGLCGKTYKEYKRISRPLEEARRRYYKGWRPNTLVDEGREIIRNVHGYENEAQAAKSMAGDLVDYVDMTLDHFYQQDEVVICTCEAATTIGQLRYHTPFVDIAPLGGDPSFDHKYNIAKRLDYLWHRYKKPITLLHFGDLDKKGLQIPTSMIKDVDLWSECDFSYKRVGITAEQAERYGVPQKPGAKRGTFEWEALSDQAAGEIISKAISEHIDLDIVRDCEIETEELTDKYQELVRERLEGLGDQNE